MWRHMMQYLLAIVAIASVRSQQQQLCKLAQNLTKSSSNTILVCTAKACPTGLQCVQGICVNYTSLSIEIGRHVATAPNNVYFSFAVWDANCNPAVLGAGTLLNSIDMYQRGILQTAYSKQSVSESGNGVLAASISNVTSKILILLDTSGSVISNWNATREAVASFIDSFASRPSTSATFVVNILTFDGREDILPISDSNGSAMTPGFVDIMTPGLSSAIRKSVVNTTSPFYDPSTNLYGALVQGSSILRSSFLTGMGMNADYLVTFTDGTDRANRIENISTVLAALNATPGIYRYCIVEQGEVDSADPNYQSEMAQICQSGLYFLSSSNNCTNNSALKDKFSEISTIITALVNNYGLFIHCASYRRGTFFMQPRFSFANNQDQNPNFQVDATDIFNTTQGVCLPQTAASWTNSNNDIPVSNADFYNSTAPCQMKYFSPYVKIHRR